MNPAPSWRAHKWPWIAIGSALLLVLLSASGITSWPDELRGMRPASEQDEFFRYIAQELAEPSLCAKIPWASRLPGGFFIAPSYERSACYDFIAGRTRNPWPCLKVRRLGGVSLLGEQTSMWSCLRDAWRGMNAGIGVSPATLAAYFSKMGYDADTLHLEGITPPVINLREVYRQFANQPDLVPRIVEATAPSRAPNLASSDPASFAYLTDMAALVSKDAKWCARIPAEMELATQKARFRDWCFFTLASNTRDISLCRRIPIRPDQTDPRLSLQSNCDRQVNTSYSVGRYGPEVPADDDRIRTVMSLLQYAIPRGGDMPAEAIYAAYMRFLEELNRNTDARHAEARRRFISRVRQLPAST